MKKPRRIGSAVILGIAYLACAGLAIRYTRFDGGVAFIWPSSALLGAWLSIRPPRDWREPIGACGLAAMLATGLWGYGWPAASGLALANLTEAVLAAWLLRSFGDRGHATDSFAWLAHLVVVLTVAAPLPAAFVAAVTLNAVYHANLAHTFWTWYLGHGLGMVVFLQAFRPVMLAYQSGQKLFASRQQLTSTLGFVAVMALVTAFSFNVAHQPMLFLPILVLSASIAWADPVALALMYATLAVIGGMLTATGKSPLGLIIASPTQRVEYFQAYLAMVVVAITPVAEAMQRRARLFIQLRESEARYRLLADNSTDIICSTAPDGTIRFISPSILQLCQYQPQEVIGRSALSLIAPEYHEVVREAHRRAIASPGTTAAAEYLGLPRLAPPRWFESHMRAVMDDNSEVECVVSVIRDMSQRKEFETALTLAALTDPLTRLPNRRLFLKALDDCIAAGKPSCIALIDLDHFKRVNDRWGHPAGDAVLVTFAEVARAGLRSTDTLARLGGEEFGLLLPGASLEVAEMICARLGSELAMARTEYEGHQIGVTTSIGIARLDRDSQAAMRMADRALYQAKAEGRDRLAIAA